MISTGNTLRLEPNPEATRGQIAVIVPTRGRPENVKRLLECPGGVLDDWYFAVDSDDPSEQQYSRLRKHPRRGKMIIVEKRKRLGPWLNQLAPALADFYPVVGFMGDDHLPRTEDWAQRVLAAFETMGSGVVYCNDLLQGAVLPTEVFISSDIVKALGFFVPRCLVHMYADNFWLDLGRALDRITYLDDVIIEHVHPLAGKASDDAGYRDVNQFMGPDGSAYLEYRQTEFDDDVARVRAAIGL